ncbi:MAG: nicotinate phosphoribosyltransferase [Candidatus Colwellbacteria bacterium]|nr:nicotinate phosphoribosyltransferase [Candidatus Colwellbacteria bacterium]
MSYWIINSLLDIDFYKFTMGQFILLNHSGTPVRFALKNRTTSIRLPESIDMIELTCQLDHVRKLRFTNTELHYLRGTNEYQDRMFCEKYLEFLKNLRLPPYRIDIDEKGQFILEFPGMWEEVTYWEIYALSIINELYFRSLMKGLSVFAKDCIRAKGVKRLETKIRELRKYPALKFTDFGTRRRFGREWQEYVVKSISEELPGQFIGTSNTKLAETLSLTPMGTSAHELPMVLSGIMYDSDESIRASHHRALIEWWDLYGQGLSIALPDTFGTDFFFETFSKEQAEKWKGLRQDSGDPFAFGYKTISFYDKMGIDSLKKMIVFSDGLEMDKMIRLFLKFNKVINVSFGWGTNLTNDLGFPALSLVVKPIEACGHPLVKLTDNIQKAMGNPEDIEKFRKIFSYRNDFTKTCVY